MLRGLISKASYVVKQGPHWKLPPVTSRSFSCSFSEAFLRWSERAYRARREHLERDTGGSWANRRRLAKHYSHDLDLLNAWRSNYLKPSMFSPKE